MLVEVARRTTNTNGISFVVAVDLISDHNVHDNFPQDIAPYDIIEPIEGNFESLTRKNIFSVDHCEVLTSGKNLPLKRTKLLKPSTKFIYSSVI